MTLAFIDACMNKGRLLSEVSRRDGRWGATVSRARTTCLHPSPSPPSATPHLRRATHQRQQTTSPPQSRFKSAYSRSHLRNLGRAMERAHFFTFSLFHCSGCAAAPLRRRPPHAGQHRASVHSKRSVFCSSLSYSSHRVPASDKAHHTADAAAAPCANVLPLTCSCAAVPPQCYRLRPSSDTAIKCADEPFELWCQAASTMRRLSMYLESHALPSRSQSNVIDGLK